MRGRVVEIVVCGIGGEVEVVFVRTVSLLVRKRVLGFVVTVVVSIRSFAFSVCCRVLCAIIGGI